MSDESAVWTKALVPANGLLIIDPATSRALVAEGATVRGNAEYWMRRLRDGDVTEVASPQAPPPSPTPPSTSKGSKS